MCCKAKKNGYKKRCKRPRLFRCEMGKENNTEANATESKGRRKAPIKVERVRGESERRAMWTGLTVCVGKHHFRGALTHTTIKAVRAVIYMSFFFCENRRDVSKTRRRQLKQNLRSPSISIRTNSDTSVVAGVWCASRCGYKKGCTNNHDCLGVKTGKENHMEATVARTCGGRTRAVSCLYFFP